MIDSSQVGRPNGSEAGPPGQNGVWNDPRCPLCGDHSWAYLFIVHGQLIFRCNGCGLTRLQPASPAPARRSARRPVPPAPVPVEPRPAELTATECEAAAAYVDLLRTILPPPASVFLLAPDDHPIGPALREHGYTAASAEQPGPPSASSYDGAVIVFQLEQAGDPLELLERVAKTLAAGAPLLLVTPSLDSLSARLLGSAWTEWRPENLTYFNRSTLESALTRAGFERVQMRVDRRRYSLEHLHRRVRTFPRTALTTLIRAVCLLTPAPLRRLVRVRLPASSIVVTATRSAARPTPRLSIVMPVFNEVRTFEAALKAVLGKELDGIEKEIIIVESNSRDGTRESVLAYREQPGVKVVLQDRPRGKGNAVREGLQHASGDFVLIQDADLEYDVNDYDALLEPLVRYQRAFVLGSRHSGSWKIRKFNDQPVLSTVFNLGHWFFLSLFNLLYGTKLEDPFTMYKVFRRECLSGLHFECDRFDFDHELVIKLMRKGYTPLEIPVNYVSRSFSEGKKVSTFRDPLTWIKAMLKYRFAYRP